MVPHTSYTSHQSGEIGADTPFPHKVTSTLFPQNHDLKQYWSIDLIHRWIPVKARRKESKKQERWRFDGEIAEELSHYIGGEVGHYSKKGSHTSFRYLNC